MSGIVLWGVIAFITVVAMAALVAFLWRLER